MGRATSEPPRVDTPASDAHLAQLVRGALGRRPRGTSGINVSSCAFVVTLHGTVGNAEDKSEVEEIVKSVGGVEGVTSKLRIA